MNDFQFIVNVRQNNWVRRRPIGHWWLMTILKWFSSGSLENKAIYRHLTYCTKLLLLRNIKEFFSAMPGVEWKKCFLQLHLIRNAGTFSSPTHVYYIIRRVWWWCGAKISFSHNKFVDRMSRLLDTQHKRSPLYMETLHCRAQITQHILHINSVWPQAPIKSALSIQFTVSIWPTTLLNNFIGSILYTIYDRMWYIYYTYARTTCIRWSNEIYWIAKS